MSHDNYAVAAGDNLWTIAKRHLGAGHRWPEIYAMNRQQIRDPDHILVGQRFAMPPRNRYGLPSRHPLQKSRPHIAHLQETATPTLQPHAAASSPQAPSLFPSGLPSIGSDPLRDTQVNNVAFKFDLALLPPIEYEVPQGAVKISWTGQIYLWRDGLRPLTTIGNRGFEMQEKRHASTVLHDLLESRKLSIGLDRRVTYEDLLSMSTYGSPDTKISAGFTVTSSSPFLTYRTQIKNTNQMLGRLGDWLFAAQDLTTNFDVELRPQPPSQTQPQAVRVPMPMPAPAPAPMRPPVPGLPTRGQTASDPEAGPSTLKRIENFAWEHRYEIAATVVLGLLTLGASAEIEGAALGARALIGAAARTTAARTLIGAGM